ncbi:sensor histidine kinase [Rubrivirga marina]|uniref:histidine kinase n=1 Tax=Rubrivirga marina TaxID=1196024 RepID=A0A271J475_9BACT|nr:HAMP domain-containing sensor histidine kinase [Rubrivirga marina]PAP78312.1 hypothetical protein BSZ37_18710 [Rubrivirga marina]
MPTFPSVEVALDALQTRADDLERQLAEARRGGDVESALDRVWTRALALDHSDETLGVAVAVFDALRELGLPVLQIGLSGQPDGGEAPVWTAGVDADDAPRASHHVTATTGHPVLAAAFAADRADGPVVEPLGRTAFETYLRASLAPYPATYADRVVARSPRAATVYVVAIPAGARQSGPLLALFWERPTDDALRVLERFAVLFGLAYARHQDLQRAEAEARTSRIDAAAERVRAQALAMRRSDDLDGAAAAVFDGLAALGVPARRATLAVVDAESRETTYWSSAAPDAPTTAHVTTIEGHPFYDALWVAWRRQRSLSYILEGDELEAYRARLGEIRADLLDAHPEREREYVHAVAAPSGVLVAFSSRPFSEDTVEVMERLVGAFQVAIERAEGLREAEARAREAEIGASVDRVRAEIASMRTTDDLDRVTPLVWQELTALGVRFFRCAVLIVDAEAEVLRVYLATPDGEPLAAIDLPFGGHPFVETIVAHWRDERVLSGAWAPDEVESWVAFLESNGLDAETARSFADPSESLALHFAPFAQGLLFVGGAAALPPDDGAAVQALADALEVAYARYDDFQRLDARTREVEAALADLRAAQERLVQSEKLASLGQLTAGIAHEIKNPLNFVNNFASLSRDLATELAAELDAEAPDADLVAEILDDLRQNAQRIEQHGRRADAIVRGMMQHARAGQGERAPADLNALVGEHANLAYHGRRAQTSDFDAALQIDLGDDVGQVDVVAQDLGRVVLNLVTNAFDAVTARAQAEAPGYQPTVRVTTRRAGATVEITVEDNGTGIPEDVRRRVFEPFYTTKPAGKGTGLGLSMSHDIVEQGHGGSLDVESTEGEGTAFVITLPA